ncbi:MAG: methyltransferase domain-containing protein, partial [Dysosmobacter sp.]|nr:methyltransferase domain-containing protein [Dysosmobacter sp.]
MESLFRCPVCGAPLDRGDRAYRCPAGHSYDIAREGYTYLLPPNQKHSADPGDDRDMAAARRDFLSKGYYDPLLNTLCCQILSLSGESPVIWDVGCGEGFYTSGIFRTLAAAGKSPRMAGTDISKPILRSAAKREKGIAWAVASSFHLPAADGAADILLDCFSPLALEEFRRVLRPGGHFLY